MCWGRVARNFKPLLEASNAARDAVQAVLRKELTSLWQEYLLERDFELLGRVPALLKKQGEALSAELIGPIVLCSRHMSDLCLDITCL